MGYPFDKKWSKRYIGDSNHAAHELEVAASVEMPHMMIYNFAIYRTTKKEVV